jgi:hypothetical protein
MRQEDTDHSHRDGEMNSKSHLDGSVVSDTRIHSITPDFVVSNPGV